MLSKLNRTLIIFSAFGFLLVSCGGPTPGQISSSGKAVDVNFKLADAIRIYTCARDKESDAAAKEKLQVGLNIHNYFKNNQEGWNESINKDRNLQYRILNDIAVKYDCF
ncbi:MAG: hypothetical protein CVV27_12330 [Candidatus Melainabacteria bacterium HGW-Melainabacteria-1]|nr:MAG: hypothetical protein CVV27_12330 [Candidatus Melainabacteria bacterium HGW-Melainabacteria-1]